jgi:two-component sensor histidine kinase
MPHRRQPRLESRRVLEILRWGSLVVPALVALVVGIAMWQRAIAEAERTARENAHLVREYVLRLVETQDLLLVAADTAMLRLQPSREDDLPTHRFLAEIVEEMNLGLDVALIGSNGDFLISSRMHPAAGNVGDRDYLRAASEGVELFVDRIRLQPDNEDALVISRRRAGETFTGVWVSSVGIESIAEFLRGIASRPGDAASVLRADGKLLVRNVPITETIVLPPDVPAMRAIQVADQGVYEARAVSDGSDRIYGFAKIGDLPLYANFGVAKANMFSDWLGRFGLVAALLGTIAVVASYLTYYAARSMAAESARAALEFDRKLLAEAEKTAAARAMMLKELNHRVKNSLQMIRSLIRLQKHREDGPDLDEINARVLAIATIHDLLYHSADSFRIDLANLLRSICASDAIVPPESNVELVCDTEPISVEANLATPLALCTVELITNAMKHAFGPEGGTIRLGLNRTDGEGILTVADDGKGMPEMPSRNSGLRVVDALVVQIRGRLSVERNHGTRFEIVFPTEPLGETEPQADEETPVPGAA